MYLKFFSAFYNAFHRERLHLLKTFFIDILFDEKILIWKLSSTWVCIQYKSLKMTKYRFYGDIILTLISLRISTCYQQERKGKVKIDVVYQAEHPFKISQPENKL